MTKKKPETREVTREVKEVRHADPKIRAPGIPEPSTREPARDPEKELVAKPGDFCSGFTWPKDKPKPSRYELRPPRPWFPCQHCDRFMTQYGTRAVVFDSGVKPRAGFAYGRCRCCGKVNKFPIATPAKP